MITKSEFEIIKRGMEHIADATLGKGHAGSDERLFANWVHVLACEDVPKLIAEMESLRILLAHAWNVIKFDERAVHLRVECDGCKEIREVLREE